MNIWIAVLAVGAASLLMRVVPVLVLGRVRLDPRTEERLATAGVSAIAALVATSARAAAEAGSPVATWAAVATGVVLALGKASMLRIIVVGGAMYAATRLGVLLFS